jgi:transcriptional regulator with XRE-family HTH domain
MQAITYSTIYPYEDIRVSRSVGYYNAVHMTWRELRSAFIRARGKRTQTAIAKECGLRPNAISKLEANLKQGPTAETFIQALEGLGRPVSEFFLQIEQAQRSDSPGQKEKGKVGLLTAEAQPHNATSSGTQGVVDALSATLRQTDIVALPDHARLAVAQALIEAGTRLTKPSGTAAPESDRALPSAHDRKSKRRSRRA